MLRALAPRGEASRRCPPDSRCPLHRTPQRGEVPHLLLFRDNPVLSAVETLHRTRQRPAHPKRRPSSAPSAPTTSNSSAFLLAEGGPAESMASKPRTQRPAGLL